MRLLATVFVLVAIGGAAPAAFVTIGNTNNAPDGDYGAVGYTYQISEYEVTGAEFQTAVDDDARIGASTPNSGNNPAANVSWLEAVKYCNWLTTGDAYLGAYLHDVNGTFLGVDRDTAISAYGIVYVLPTEDEWYKAAFYNPDTDSYSLYANGTNTAPSTSESRYGAGSTWAVGSGTAEQNGTYDMMGNIYEWTESFVSGEEGNRVLRGGYYGSTTSDLMSSSRIGNSPAAEEIGGGFRVAAVPEPSTVGLFGLSGLVLLLARRLTRREKKTETEFFDLYNFE